MSALAGLILLLPLVGCGVPRLRRARVSGARSGVVAAVVRQRAASSLAILCFAFRAARLPPRSACSIDHLGTWSELAWIGAGPLSRSTSATRARPALRGDVLVVTGVGFLIHVYSSATWRTTPRRRGFKRFFAYLNLFMFAMLMLVLADNLVLCSSAGRASGCAPTS